MEVSRETFVDSSEKTQNLLLFDSIQALHNKLDGFNAGCEAKHVKIDESIRRSAKVNKLFSAGSGALSGFMAVVGAKFFGVSI